VSEFETIIMNARFQEIGFVEDSKAAEQKYLHGIGRNSSMSYAPVECASLASKTWSRIMLYSFQAVRRLGGPALGAVLNLAIQEGHRWSGCVNQVIGHPGR